MRARFLLIDAGNTRLKWATANARGPIRVAGEIATKDATPAWVRKFVRQFADQQIVLASVVPKVTRAFARSGGQRIHLVTGASPALGLRFDYPKPAELGADRLAAAVAAHAAGVFPVIVVNCGTATAFTVLDQEGTLCGGAIAPGLHTQLAALLGATAQLPATALRPPRRYLARSTQEAIRTGVLLNFQGGVKEILQHLADELPGPWVPNILLTGGHARHLAQATGATLRPLLVFEGLRIMGVRTFSPTL